MLGDLLLLHRRIYNLSVRDLAKQIGVSHATLHRVEHGKNMDGQTMIKLFNWLFGGAI